ncbi:MAG: tetratricopeptide repeat protein [Solirubrobacteraceae bacterium]|nr:tetratricopeptide repeat protein [Solirubrobacteraceae bacterium]
MTHLSAPEIIARSESLREAGQDTESLALLEEGVRCFPADPEIRIMLASNLLRLRPSEAREQIAEAIALDVNDARRVTRAAVMLFDLGELDGARQYVAHALRILPRDDAILEVELTVLGGEIASTLGEHEVAEEAFRAAVEAFPQVEHYWVTLAQFLVDQGRIDEARSAIKEGLDRASGGVRLQSVVRSLG